MPKPGLSSGVDRPLDPGVRRSGQRRPFPALLLTRLISMMARLPRVVVTTEASADGYLGSLTVAARAVQAVGKGGTPLSVSKKTRAGTTEEGCRVEILKYPYRFALFV